jgi:hypothetical protein
MLATSEPHGRESGGPKVIDEEEFMDINALHRQGYT